MMQYLLTVLLSAAAALAHAEVQVDACEAPVGCRFVSDPYPPAPAAQPETCALIGAGAQPIVAPSVDGAGIVPPVGVGRACYWERVILAPGAYSLTATATDRWGRVSAPSAPFVLTVRGPVPGAPQGLRAHSP